MAFCSAGCLGLKMGLHCRGGLSEGGQRWCNLVCRLLGTLSSTDLLAAINGFATNELGDVFCICVIVSAWCFFAAHILLLKWFPQEVICCFQPIFFNYVEQVADFNRE